MGVRNPVGRFTALGVGAIASMIVLALAVLFANSYSTGQVTNNARTLHSTNSLLGASAVLRAANNQAALFARDAALETASEEARDIAIEEATRTRETFANVADAIDTGLLARDDSLDENLEVMGSSSAAAMELASSGDHPAAFEVLSEVFEPAYQQARASLREIQADTIAAINDTETVAGWVGAATRFLAILLLPTIAIIIYRRIARTQARERRLEFEARLEYERRLSASKDELLAGVSHQLRTPVTGIFGMADVLADGTGVDEATHAEFVRAIRTEAADLDRMVADLLVTSRLDADAVAFKEEPFIVANAAERAAAPARKSGVDISVAIDASIRAVGDLDRVVHIIRNLVSNAHRHGGPGISVSADVEGKLVTIVVEDDGTESLVDQGLFESFANGGTGALTAGSVGLGLSVARRLARGMSGDLVYERVDDRTRFVLTLPAPVAEPTSELVEARTSS